MKEYTVALNRIWENRNPGTSGGESIWMQQGYVKVEASSQSAADNKVIMKLKTGDTLEDDIDCYWNAMPEGDFDMEEIAVVDDSGECKKVFSFRKNQVMLEFPRSEYLNHERDAKANGMTIEDHLLMMIRMPDLTEKTRIACGEKKEDGPMSNREKWRIIRAGPTRIQGSKPKPAIGLLMGAGLTPEQDAEVKRLAGPLKTKTPKTSVVTGVTAKELTDVKVIKAIKEARAGGMTYMQIEEKFGLRRAKGMTAVRILSRR